jgi:hypothetical protein
VKYNLLLLGAALDERLRDTDVVVHHVHPGLVDTPMLRGFYAARDLPQDRESPGPSQPLWSPLWRYLRGRVLLSPAEGARNVLAAALAPRSFEGRGDTAHVPYFVNGLGLPSPHRLSRHLAMDHHAAQQVKECFRDAVEVLPEELRRLIVARLRSLPQVEHISAAAKRPSSSQMAARRKALERLAEEMEAVSRK